MTASAQRHTADRRLGALRAAPALTLLGLAGSVLITLAGSRLSGGSVTWWFAPQLGSGKPDERLVLYLGVIILIAAWLGLGPLAREARLDTRRLWLIAALWCLPLAVGAPLFSRDIYSYLAQGTIAHLGLNPYHTAPAALARLGQTHVMSAVDPFWRGQTAPYGPLFLGVISLIVAATGSHLVAGALLIRAFDLIGLVLLAVCIPRLARIYGANPARAVWLTAASPLVLLQLVSPAHNDLLMAGLMVAGITLALERHVLIGLAVCGLAATVKLPAILAVAFLGVSWIRAEPSWRRRVIRSAQAAGAVGAALAAVTVVTGFGLGWISSGLFSTPARVRLAVTPATDISWSVAKVLDDLGVRASFHGIDSVLRVVFFAVAVLVTLVLLERSRRSSLVPYLGLALVAFVIGGPALWPWYLSWGLVLLAAWPAAQRSRLFVLALIVGSLLVKPGGILALPLESSPAVACLWLVSAIALWLRWRRRAAAAAPRPSEAIGSTRSAVAEPSAR